MESVDKILCQPIQAQPVDENTLPPSEKRTLNRFDVTTAIPPALSSLLSPAALDSIAGHFSFASPKTAFFLASQPQIARACIGCMILHARKCTFHPLPHQYWRGLRPFMQLHEKRHMKCAGEAGEVLRAD
ncbi:TPA: hypothetical protein ACXII3_002666 [Serratia marcescens]